MNSVKKIQAFEARANFACHVWVGLYIHTYVILLHFTECSSRMIAHLSVMIATQNKSPHVAARMERSLGRGWSTASKNAATT